MVKYLTTQGDTINNYDRTMYQIRHIKKFEVSSSLKQESLRINFDQ